MGHFMSHASCGVAALQVCVACLMEESQEILFNSLKSFGIEIPSEISSFREINRSTLFSICAQSLRRLSLYSGVQSPSLPTSLPDSIIDCVRICNDVACTLKNLGFVGDPSFHKFMYPSEEDMYKLVRFFVIRLSQTSESIEFAESPDIHVGADNAECNSQITSEVCLEATAHYWISEFLGNNDVFSVGKPNNEADAVSEIDQESNNAVSEIMDQKAIPGSFPGMLCISKDSGGNNDIRELMSLFSRVCQIEDKKGDVYDFPEFVERSSSVQELPSEELETMKDARKMGFGGRNLMDFQQNNEGNCRGALQDNNALLLKSLHLSSPGPHGKVQRLKDIELETESVLFEIRNREEECLKLTADFEKQMKFPSRRPYVERISEITKNSRKQDTDIESIIKETRGIQLESNSLEERLHRSYAVVDEMVFREAKKDIVSHQVHRLLTSIHHNFAEIRGKKLETERTRREVASIEGELSTLASRSFRMEKLQTDLDAIKWENDSLERQLHDAFQFKNV